MTYTRNDLLQILEKEGASADPKITQDSKNTTKAKLLSMHTTEIRKKGDVKYYHEKIKDIQTKIEELKQKYNFSSKYKAIERLKKNIPIPTKKILKLIKAYTYKFEKYTYKY